MATEKRFIEANALKSFVCEFCNSINSDEPCEPADCRCMALIDVQPTVDAVEVVHASWIDEFGGKYANPKYICSNCTLKALYKKKLDVLGKWQTVQALTDYCPNCGAKMDGDGNGA